MSSNLDLWYCAGIVVLGASFSYIVLSAAQFMGLSKKEQKSSATGPSDAPPTQFLRHALLAFVGIMVGAQLLQYHQDQQEMSKKDIGRDMAMARALSSKGTAAPAASGAAGAAAANPGGLGERPTSRPPRGYFSVAEAEKAAATAAVAAVAAVIDAVPAQAVPVAATPAATVTAK